MNQRITYNPQYFLAALGNGGIAVSFFMYFMFFIPHPETPMPLASDMWAILTGDSLVQKIAVALVYVAILFFASRHFYYLVWNIRKYRTWKQTDAYTSLVQSNNAVSLMAMPLTYGMTLNVSFVLGAVLVPGLWDVIEYLLPGATLAFFLVGLYALSIYVSYFTRFLEGTFDVTKNNHLGQMLAIFAFGMIAVGLAAPAGMSRVGATSATAMILSIFFATIAVSLGLVKTMLGVREMLKRGIPKESAPTLWIMVPVLTVMGITFVRLYSGASYNFFNVAPSPFAMFFVLAILLSLEIAFLLIGYIILRRIGYFEEYTHTGSPNASVGSYALICPGVSFYVLGMFFIGWGLIKTGILEQWSIVHLLLLAPFIASQWKSIQVFERINKKVLY